MWGNLGEVARGGEGVQHSWAEEGVGWVSGSSVNFPDTPAGFRGSCCENSLLCPLPCWPPPPQVGAQTETELKEKKLRVEDALNATKAAVEEGIVIGGGCTLLKLAAKVDQVKETLSNEEQKV
jgi:hypothetical protein